MSGSFISTVGLPVAVWGSPKDIVVASRAEIRTEFPKAAPIPSVPSPIDRLVASAWRYDEF
jgi:hypothetical protein